MKYREIASLPTISKVDADKARKIAESMRVNGYVGCPILVYGGQLLTGSHRLAALELLSEDDDLDLACDVWAWEVAEDVTDIVEERMEAFCEKNGYYPDIDYSDIGYLLAGSWVEEYKDEIVEW